MMCNDMEFENEKVKRTFPEFEACLKAISEDPVFRDLNTFSILGARGFGKTTILKALKKNLPSSMEGKASTASVLSVLRLEGVKDGELLSWIIGALSAPMKKLEKEWANSSVIKKEDVEKCVEEKLGKDKNKYVQMTQQPCESKNYPRPFPVKNAYEKLTAGYFKCNTMYKTHLIKTNYDDLYYLDKSNDVLKSEIDLIDDFHSFLDFFSVYYEVLHEVDGFRFVLLIDDLDMFPEKALSFILDIGNFCAHERIVNVISGDLESLKFLFEHEMAEKWGMSEGLVKKQHLVEERLKKFIPPSKRYYLKDADPKVRAAFVPLEASKDGPPLNEVIIKTLKSIDSKNDPKNDAACTSTWLTAIAGGQPRTLINLYTLFSEVSEELKDIENKEGTDKSAWRLKVLNRFLDCSGLEDKSDAYFAVERVARAPKDSTTWRSLEDIVGEISNHSDVEEQIRLVKLLLSVLIFRGKDIDDKTTQGPNHKGELMRYISQLINSLATKRKGAGWHPMPLDWDSDQVLGYLKCAMATLRKMGVVAYEHDENQTEITADIWAYAEDYDYLLALASNEVKYGES
ncbi:hypothetical protein ACR6HW_08755 [Fusibacter sp. JL298sf-3]